MIDRGAYFPEVAIESNDGRAGEKRSSFTTSVDLKRSLHALVGGRLSAVEHQLRLATTSQFQAVNDLTSQAAEMGGKRLRPVLTLLSMEACCQGALSTTQEKDLVSIAAAVELVHAASLVHDDVMDGAVQRRHRPTIGSVAGSSAAILLGDFLFTRAYAMAATCRNGFPARQIARASTQLCEGELRQQLSAGNWELSLQEYREILGQKTGALCGVGCRLGAWVVEATDDQSRGLAKFGRLLGIAFQVFDDWLDYWGSEDVGKTLGTDLAQAKPTVPLIRLLATLPDVKRREVIELIESGSPQAMEAVRPLLDESDAREYTLELARRCVQKAIGCLSILPSSLAKSALSEIAKFSVARAD